MMAQKNTNKGNKFKNYANESGNLVGLIDGLGSGALTEDQTAEFKKGITSYVLKSSQRNFGEPLPIFAKDSDGNFVLDSKVSMERLIAYAKGLAGKDYGKTIKNEFSNYIDAHWDEVSKMGAGALYEKLLSPLETYGRMANADLSQIANSTMGAGAKQYNSLRTTLEDITLNIKNKTDIDSNLFESAAEEYVSKFKIDPENEEEDLAFMEYVKNDIVKNKNLDSSKIWLLSKYHTKMIDCIKSNNGLVKEYAKEIPKHVWETNGKPRYDNIKETLGLYNALQSYTEKAEA